MLPSFATTTVQRIRPGTATERGAAIRDWANATTADITGCHVQPDGTSSDYSDREQASLTYTLWAPSGSDIRKGDRVAVDGHTFDVVGVPFAWASPNGAVSHMTCRMTEWEG